jgi:hypothetical protein
LLAIVEAAVETAKRAKELAEAPKITAEETHPLASQDEIPAKETRPLASLLKEAKGEIACLSTAMCVSEECQQSEVMPVRFWLTSQLFADCVLINLKKLHNN